MENKISAEDRKFLQIIHTNTPEQLELLFARAGLSEEFEKLKKLLAE